MKKRISVIGGGLAGSEACSYLLSRGYEVHLYERRPLVDDKAHHTSLFGELVCSNSLKSKQLDNACGLLKEELRIMCSICMEAAKKSEVPSGNALSVDRDIFATEITAKLKQNPNLIVHIEDVEELMDGPVVLCTGPLTSQKLLDNLQEKMGEKSLSFFDASAPIVKKDSIDFSIAFYQSRYGQGDDAYINCPFTKEEYFTFVKELLSAKKAELHSFDTSYFEGCLPIEVIASRGMETLRHGPLKPFGLSSPSNPRPYAVVQLRQDTLLGDYYNLVGFQTNLTYPEQKRVFSLIPGLGHAEFLRYGLMHRNAYLDSPRVLNEDLSLKIRDDVFVGGQLSGVEGYVESMALGLLAAINADRRVQGKPFIKVPESTVLGALSSYILHSPAKRLEPMNANWALLNRGGKKEKSQMIEDALWAIKHYWRQISE